MYDGLSAEERDLIGVQDVAPAQLFRMPSTTIEGRTAYDASDMFDKSSALWNAPLRSADAEILPEKAGLDAKVRDQFRNDGYAQTGQILHRDNIVGSQFVLSHRPNYTFLGKDEAWADKHQEEVEALWSLSAESIDNWIDASRTNNFTAMMRLVVGVYTAGGEILATVEWGRDFGRPFGTMIQLIDADRLSNPHNVTPFDQRVRGGVKQDKYGAPIGYYIRKSHPSDYDRWRQAWEWDYVRARTRWGRPNVLHLKEQVRIDQTRGVSELVAGLMESRITKQFRKITLQNAVANAMYAASIESELPSEQVFQALGGGNMLQDGADVGNFMAEYAAQYLGAVGQYARSAQHMRLDGVKIPHFFPGTKLQLRPVGNPGGVGQEFEASLLRHLASLLGVTYEQLSRDYSKTNYSSARAALVETWKFMQGRKAMIADRFATMVFRLWYEEMWNAGAFTTLPVNAIDIYEPMVLDALTTCEWIGAARGQIDELKETQAAGLRLKSNLSTFEDELGRQGKDYRKVFAQIAREKKLMEELDIAPILDDNMMNAVSGDTREAGGGETNGASAD